MKQLIVISTLLLNFHIYSQTYEKSLLILDGDSKQPIENVLILLLKTKQLLFSNSDGKLLFQSKGGTNLQLSHPSYHQASIKWTSLKQKTDTIFLKSKINTLDNIVLSKTHPEKLIKELAENSLSKLNIPVRLKVYCREFFKTDGQYASFNDGLINFQLLKEHKKLKSVLLVEQNRSFGLIDQHILPDLLGYNLNSMMEKYYELKILRPLLDEKLRKMYSFIVKTSKDSPNRHEISAIPLEGSTELLDTFKIIYDVQRKLILQINAELSPTVLAAAKEETTKGVKNIKGSFYQINFRVETDKYYLVSSKEEIHFNMHTGKEVKNIEVLNNMITTNFNFKHFTYKDINVFKDKTLYNIKNTILTDYWKISGLTPTEKEEEIINNLKESFWP